MVHFNSNQDGRELGGGTAYSAAPVIYLTLQLGRPRQPRRRGHSTRRGACRRASSCRTPPPGPRQILPPTTHLPRRTPRTAPPAAGARRLVVSRKTRERGGRRGYRGRQRQGRHAARHSCHRPRRWRRRCARKRDEVRESGKQSEKRAWAASRILSLGPCDASREQTPAVLPSTARSPPQKHQTEWPPRGHSRMTLAGGVGKQGLQARVDVPPRHRKEVPHGASQPTLPVEHGKKNMIFQVEQTWRVDLWRE